MAGVTTHIIAKLRENLGMTQQDLATRSGVAVRTIQTMETGARTRPTTRRKVLRILGLEYSTDGAWVFGEAGYSKIVLVLDDGFKASMHEVLEQGAEFNNFTLEILAEYILEAMDENLASVTLKVEDLDVSARTD